MLLDAEPTLEDLVVTVLVVHPNRTAPEITAIISKHYRSCSTSSVYQELRKLQARAVITKGGKHYSLRLGWVLDLWKLAEQMHERYHRHSHLASFLPDEENSLRWSFRTIRELGRFWTQLIIALCNQCTTRMYFEWAPHAWFGISHPPEESQLLRVLQLKKVTYLLMIGTHSRMSREYTKELRGTGARTSFAAGPFAAIRNQYFSLIDDYLVTVRLSADLVQRLDHLAQQSPAEAGFGALRTFEAEGTISFLLEHRKKKAHAFRKLFADYWDLPRNLLPGSS